MITELLVLGIICLGFYFYIKIARANKSEKISGYFLGGRNVNESLFEHATWGTSFALNNGIYWGIYFGYTAGLSALWINGSWALGFIALSMIIPKMIKPTSKYTIHGFLGSVYGPRSRIFASMATATALLLNMGSEIVFASLFLSKILGLVNLELILVFMFAVFAASYCSIGGYRANAAIDRFQNLISVISLLLIVAMLAVFKTPVTMIMIILFVIGALFLGYFIWDNLKRDRETNIQNILLLLAIISIISVCWLSDYYPTRGLFKQNILASLKDTKGYASDYIVGLIVFQFFYQFVDTVNWQNISAHNISVEEKNKLGSLKNALKNSGFKILIAPIFICTFIGILFGMVSPQNTDTESSLIVALLKVIIPAGNQWVYGTLLGFIAFGLIGAGLSGVDSWLMATSQTFSWDIIDHKKFEEKEFKLSNFSEEEQSRLTGRAKSLLFLFAIVGALLYYGLLTASEGKIAVLFFVIFSASLSLLPSVAFALFRDGRPARNLSFTSCLSIVAGYLVPVILVFYSFFNDSLDLGFVKLTNDSFYTYGPIFAIAVSGVTFLTGYFLSRKVTA